VRPGDLVIADHDGIVVLDPARAEATLRAAAEVKLTEARIVARLDAGDGLRACLNMEEHATCLAAGQPSTLRITV
jgi:regulator of RNase E activity RraA